MGASRVTVDSCRSTTPSSNRFIPSSTNGTKEDTSSWIAAIQLIRLSNCTIALGAQKVLLQLIETNKGFYRWLHSAKWSDGNSVEVPCVQSWQLTYKAFINRQALSVGHSSMLGFLPYLALLVLLTLLQKTNEKPNKTVISRDDLCIFFFKVLIYFIVLIFFMCYFSLCILTL